MQNWGEPGGSPSRRWPSIEILGVPVARIDAAMALAEIEQLYDDELPAVVAYANAHTLNLASGDAQFRSVLRRAAIVLNDGSGLALAARLQGRRFPANLNGTDFTPMILCLAAGRGWPVFFLGARPGIADAAAARFQGSIPDLVVAGTHHGYITPEETERVVSAIRESGAGILIAAMGNPAQELWLDRYLPQTGARMGIGVGALLDFAADAVPRAPHWMRRLGVEWVYRLTREPDRMWRRYLLGNPLFLTRVVRDELRAGITAWTS